MTIRRTTAIAALLAAAPLSACGNADTSATAPAPSAPAPTVAAPAQPATLQAFSGTGMMMSATLDEGTSPMAKHLAKAHEACGSKVYVYEIQVDNSSNHAVEDGIAQTSAVVNGETVDSLNNENNDADGNLYHKCSESHPGEIDSDAVKIGNELRQKVLPGTKMTYFAIYAKPLPKGAQLFATTWSDLQPVQFN